MVCEPTAIGRLNSFAILERSLFISSVKSDPPVMALIISGKLIFLFKNIVEVSTS